MKRKFGLFLILIALTFFSSFPWANLDRVNASNTFSVHNINTGLDYQTIQSAIDDNQTLDGHTILVREGTYYEHVAVNKSILLIGQNRSTTVIDGNSTGAVVLVTAHNVTVKGFSVRNGEIGIHVDHSNDSSVDENNVFQNVDGIDVTYSNNCTIDRNAIENNTQRGILVTNSRNFAVSGNSVFLSGWYGINSNASANGLILANVIRESYFDGIGLLQTDGCVVAENNVNENSVFGIWIESSNNVVIYHNNFVSNNIQASVSTSACLWDNGAEGNYWSNYTGVDHNGIGDNPHAIAVNNTDHYPLVGLFYNFDTSLGINVPVVCNSTIDSFAFFESNSSIKMHVSNTTSKQTWGFCRLTISHDLLHPPYNVMVNGYSVAFNVVYENGTLSIIYFSYEHSTLEITIVPEFGFLFLLFCFTASTLIVAVLHKRRHLHWPGVFT
jgi:parallel beta-helix repeat protein